MQRHEVGFVFSDDFAGNLRRGIVGYGRIEGPEFVFPLPDNRFIELVRAAGPFVGGLECIALELGPVFVDEVIDALVVTGDGPEKRTRGKSRFLCDIVDVLGGNPVVEPEPGPRTLSRKEGFVVDDGMSSGRYSGEDAGVCGIGQRGVDSAYSIDPGTFIPEPRETRQVFEVVQILINKSIYGNNDEPFCHSLLRAYYIMQKRIYIPNLQNPNGNASSIWPGSSAKEKKFSSLKPKSTIIKFNNMTILGH